MVMCLAKPTIQFSIVGLLYIVCRLYFNAQKTIFQKSLLHRIVFSLFSITQQNVFLQELSNFYAFVDLEAYIFQGT